MSTTFRCSIVTPTAAVFEGDVTYASFPAWDGQEGMMKGKSPRLTRLGVGSLRLDQESGQSRWYVLDGGFAQVQPDQLTLLTEHAWTADDISLEDAEAELAEANARVTTAGEDREKVTIDQQRAMAKIAFMRSHGRS